MQLNAFAISGLLLAFTSGIVTLILLIYGRSKLHRIWTLFNFVVMIWGLGSFFIANIQDKEIALLFWRWIKIPITFIPILNYHVVYLLCNLKNKKTLTFFYLQGIFFSVAAIFSPDFITGVTFVFESFYYDNFGALYYPYIILWFFIVFYTHVLLVVSFLNSNPRLRHQLLYFFTGTVLGFSGGMSNFFPTFGINFYPIGNFTIPIYCVVITYAILKYRLLDINIILTRTGIFIVIYSFVLGIPFAMAILGQDILIGIFKDSWWVFPLLSSTILASLGPYIYSFIQKKAEERLLQEQRLYQSTLRKASLGMGQIKDLQKLLNLIVHIVTRAVKIEHSEIYLFHESSNNYVLKAEKGEGRRRKESIVKNNDALIKILIRSKEPVVYDEIKQKSQDFKDKDLRDIEQSIVNLNSELIVPSFIESKLIAFIALGKKKSGKSYTQDDLVVFSILASQAALAIENAMFYEETKRTHEQLFKAEKMATIGTMADGLSHQINNRLHAMGFIAGDAIDTLKRFKGKNVTEEVQKLLDDMQNALVRIEDNVKRGGEIVQGLLTYTRKGEEGFSAVELNKLLDSSIEMVSYKVKTKQIEFVRNFNGKIPRIKGNFTQLQEVLFNVIDNANDAIDQRKDELKEPGFHGRIEFEAHTVGLNKLELIVKDNGMGVKEENMRKIFTPFFTTKLSSKKGTGLGMYVIKQIIEENHKGKVEFISKYKEGSTTKMLLPIYSADLNKS